MSARAVGPSCMPSSALRHPNVSLINIFMEFCRAWDCAAGPQKERSSSHQNRVPQLHAKQCFWVLLLNNLSSLSLRSILLSGELRSHSISR